MNMVEHQKDHSLEAFFRRVLCKVVLFWNGRVHTYLSQIGSCTARIQSAFQSKHPLALVFDTSMISTGIPAFTNPCCLWALFEQVLLLSPDPDIWENPSNCTIHAEPINETWWDCVLEVCQVSWSGPKQGLKAHVDRYKNSPVMHKRLVGTRQWPFIGFWKEFSSTIPRLRAPKSMCSYLFVEFHSRVIGPEMKAQNEW